MPIAELAPAPYNPRKDLRPGDREYESLKRSIQEFGMVDPVIFNTRTKRVVGGHQRLTVLRDLGHTTAPTVLVELDEKREKALNLALNKIAGEWDMPMLSNAVIIASRLSGEAKAGQILLTQRLHAGVEQHVDAEAIGELSLRGQTRPVVAFNVRSLRAPE